MPFWQTPSNAGTVCAGRGGSGHTHTGTQVTAPGTSHRHAPVTLSTSTLERRGTRVEPRARHERGTAHTRVCILMLAPGRLRPRSQARSILDSHTRDTSHRGVSCPGAWVMLVFRLRKLTFAKNLFKSAPPSKRSHTSYTESYTEINNVTRTTRGDERVPRRQPN